MPQIVQKMVRSWHVNHRDDMMLHDAWHNMAWIICDQDHQCHTIIPMMVLWLPICNIHMSRYNMWIDIYHWSTLFMMRGSAMHITYGLYQLAILGLHDSRSIDSPPYQLPCINRLHYRFQDQCCADCVTKYHADPWYKMELHNLRHAPGGSITNTHGSCSVRSNFTVHGTLIMTCGL